MGKVINLLFCSFAVVVAQVEVKFEVDRPYLKVQLNEPALLECCFITSVKSLTVTWVKQEKNAVKATQSIIVTDSDIMVTKEKRESGSYCGILDFISTKLNDTGLYQCWLNHTIKGLYTPGTYLQVNEPLAMAINLSETTKNKILTAEGILLLLCVLLPASYLLLQARQLHELDKRKVKREEENIYQGLNLDDCSSTYDRIERSQTHGPYEDVCNVMEDEEIQLEKP